MTVLARTSDELQTAPALAILSPLSACIDAFVSALDVAHPGLLQTARDRASDRETLALLLHMHLDFCQELLEQYDYLTFDAIGWDSPEPTEPAPDPDHHDDDIPF
jgi:hypothetical protein